MTLRNLLKGVKIIELNISLDEEINDIIGDSRQIKEGCAFICLEGTKFDGHLYIKDAFKLGAKVAITQKKVNDLDLYIFKK